MTQTAAERVRSAMCPQHMKNVHMLSHTARRVRTRAGLEWRPRGGAGLRCLPFSKLQCVRWFMAIHLRGAAARSLPTSCQHATCGGGAVAGSGGQTTQYIRISLAV